MATANAIQNRNSFVIQQYGESSEVLSLAKRIKIMVPNGNTLTDPEAQALAQVSLITNCNPFIGEIWYIHTKGPMIGIKGARRHGDEQILEAGGKDAYWTPTLSPCSGEEAGYKGKIEDLAAAWKCVINDSVSTGKYQKMFLETVNVLRAAGSKDPVGEAREICGTRPQWIGYGFATVSETSRMNKQALAMKRCEADALKKRFHIPFGVEVSSGDTAAEAGAPEWIEGKASDPQPEQPAEGYNQDPEATETEAIELVDPWGDKVVAYAAKEWNTDSPHALSEIKKRIPSNKPMDKRDIKAIILGESEAPKKSQQQNMKELGFGN